MAITDLPRPVPTELSRPFWDAAQEGRLVLQKCDACASYRWTPQILCTRCHAQEFTWTQVSGEGRVHSFTVVHRAPLPCFETPYVVAVVQIDEGPLMLTNIVGCPPDDVRIDMPVKVAFERISPEISVYRFSPR